MEHKPAHIVTNLPIREFVKQCELFKLDVEAIAEDEDQTNPHIHALIAWPIGKTTGGARILKPRRPNFVRSCRRKYGCVQCHNSQSNARCTSCQLFFKPIWPKTPEHLENIKRYIARKIGAVFWGHEPDETWGEDGENHTSDPSQVPSTSTNL